MLSQKDLNIELKILFLEKTRWFFYQQKIQAKYFESNDPLIQKLDQNITSLTSRWTINF